MRDSIVPPHAPWLGFALARARPLCLIVPGREEPGLAHGLRAQLEHELPWLAFTLREQAGVASIWLCGWSPEHEQRLPGLRARHPGATIVATRRGALDGWHERARALGADRVRSWPLPASALRELLAARPS
jgi:hypothetical protein